jgi:hypothetical protein
LESSVSTIPFGNAAIINIKPEPKYKVIIPENIALLTIPIIITNKSGHIADVDEKGKIHLNNLFYF